MYDLFSFFFFFLFPERSGGGVFGDLCRLRLSSKASPPTRRQGEPPPFFPLFPDEKMLLFFFLLFFPPFPRNLEWPRISFYNVRYLIRQRKRFFFGPWFFFSADHDTGSPPPLLFAPSFLGPRLQPPPLSRIGAVLERPQPPLFLLEEMQSGPARIFPPFGEGVNMKDEEVTILFPVTVVSPSRTEEIVVLLSILEES